MSREIVSIIQINPLNPQDEQNKNTDRQITITGAPEAQWKSQYYIYEKLRQDGLILFELWQIHPIFVQRLCG